MPVKQQNPSVEEPTTDNTEAPIELTPAFIDITKITPEQKIRLQNSVIGVKPDELIAKVNNMDDKGLRMQIIDQLLFVDGGAYGAMRLLGMVDNALTPMNKIPSHRKIDATVLAKFERKNRVYREYENVLFNKKLISNEFGQKALIPEDVKSAYKMFAYKALSDRYREDFTSRVTKPGREIKNSGKNYAIVSKTDGHVYLFDSKHALVSRKAAIMGKDRSNTPYDVKNYTNTSEIPDRTPAGLYTIGNNSYVDGNLGFFMTLEPKDGQITYRTHKSGPDAGKYARAIGFHKIYEPLKDTRNVALKSDDPSARFTTNGCINIDTYSYSELYDHLAKNAAVYITA